MSKIQIFPSAEFWQFIKHECASVPEAPDSISKAKTGSVPVPLSSSDIRWIFKEIQKGRIVIKESENAKKKSDKILVEGDCKKEMGESLNTKTEEKKSNKENIQSNNKETKSNKSELKSSNLSETDEDIIVSEEKPKDKQIDHSEAEKTKQEAISLSSRCLNKFLRDSRVVLPTLKATPRSPELEARVERLRAEQANLEYNRMTRYISPNTLLPSEKSLNFSLAHEMKEMNRHMVTGLQFLLSIVGTFIAIFAALHLLLHEGWIDMASKILTATFGAIVVAIAEVYFVIVQDMSGDKAKVKKGVGSVTSNTKLSFNSKSASKQTITSSKKER